jgi:hypothetical protein
MSGLAPIPDKPLRCSEPPLRVHERLFALQKQMHILVSNGSINPGHRSRDRSRIRW